MTNSARPARRLTARQLAKALAEIDAQLAPITTALAELLKAYDGREVPEIVGEAWNHLHDAHDRLSEHRARVALNPAPIPASEWGTAQLAAQNID